MFRIDNPQKLEAMMKTAIRNGARLIEIPFPICELPWDQVGEIARNAGVEEISLCHFWVINPDGTSAWGDPLGGEAEEKKSLATISRMIDALKAIRKNGVIARFIDGPLWGGLGWDYTNLTPTEKEDRAVLFLKKAGHLCAVDGVFLAVECLRPGEGKVIGGTAAMVKILTRVDHINVGMHFDCFHSEEWGEDPAKSILLGKGMIIYLHLHGSKRVAPETGGDKVDWGLLIRAVNQIDVSPAGPIPVVSEPFGEETRRDNPTLGEGLPPTLPLEEYLPQARRVFTRHGLFLN